jgi:hypothetical protein
MELSRQRLRIHASLDEYMASEDICLLDFERQRAE